jgi:hypothetical protein
MLHFLLLGRLRWRRSARNPYLIHRRIIDAQPRPAPSLGLSSGLPRSNGRLSRAESDVDAHESVRLPLVTNRFAHKVLNEAQNLLGCTAMFLIASRHPIKNTVLSPQRPRFAAGSIHVGFVEGQSGTGTGFSSSSVFPCQCIIPPSLSKLVSSAECVICWRK